MFGKSPNWLDIFNGPKSSVMTGTLCGVRTTRRIAWPAAIYASNVAAANAPDASSLFIMTIHKLATAFGAPNTFVGTTARSISFVRARFHADPTANTHRTAWTAKSEQVNFNWRTRDGASAGSPFATGAADRVSARFATIHFAKDATARPSARDVILMFVPIA